MSAFVSTGLFVDGFAGGGGASTGIKQAIGRDVDIAINHSPSAIAIHKANHPDTEHHCQDIRIVWPTAATRMRPVAGAWFSPDCKEHSKAKGGPVKDRNIRQLPWEILPWLQETRPTVCYIENVEEMQLWGPLDADGHVIKELRGTEFKRWINAIRRIGYRVEKRELRACDYGAPTSRKRLYIVMRCDGLPIVWPKPTHGKPGSPGVRSGRLLPYRSAAECIDWSIPCPSIFDRKRPLKDATHRRIAHGVMRYVVNAAKPFIVNTANSKTTGRGPNAWPIDDPLRTVTTANGFAATDVLLAASTDFDRPPHANGSETQDETGAPLGKVEGESASRWEHPASTALPNQFAPHVTKFHGTGVGSSMEIPLPTVTANGVPTRPAGATPLGMVGATLAKMATGNAPTSAEAPLQTIEGKAKHSLVGAALAPLISYGQHGGANRPIDEPHHTIAASKKDTNGIVAAALAPLQNGERRPGEKPREQALSEPFSTIATGGKFSAIAATMVQTGYGERPGQAPRALDVNKPLGTTVAGGGKHAAVTAFLSSFYGSDRVNGGGDPQQPAKTVRAGGQHHAIVTAHIEQANGGPRNTNSAGRDARRPLSTVTTAGSQQRIVETTLIEEGALPPELMERAVLVAAFLCKYYISPTRWTDRSHGFLATAPTGYVACGATPDLKAQHPKNWAEIEADFDAWNPYAEQEAK